MGVGVLVFVVLNFIDVVKMRVMNMKVVVGEVFFYKGVLDCVVKIVCLEGFMVLYKGFIFMVIC